MAQKNQTRSILSIIWNRLKRSLVQEHRSKTLALRAACQDQPLERCLAEGFLVEKARKQLERQWSEITH
ncbi:MAG: hypothetical protein WA947_18650 [Phormidesmis sp.]